uniref:Uncharacterized protein n=1 Tax=Romanomermis culicivorax TaxID=13658 RepID=A0A915IFJ5_ROMCU
MKFGGNTTPGDLITRWHLQRDDRLDFTHRLRLFRNEQILLKQTIATRYAELQQLLNKDVKASKAVPKSVSSAKEKEQ